MSTTHIIHIAGVTEQEIEQAISQLDIQVSKHYRPWQKDKVSWGAGDVDISLHEFDVQVHYAGWGETHQHRGYRIFKRLSKWLHKQHIDELLS